MKKCDVEKKSKKLSLAKETLRTLSTAELGQVAGGTLEQPVEFKAGKDL